MSTRNACSPVVVYRPFEEADLVHVSRIIADIWWPIAVDEPSRELFGKADFAGFYQHATFSRVAVVDGAPAGIVLARAGRPDPAHQAAWRERAAIVERLIAATAPEEAAHMEQYLSREERIDAQLLAQSGCSDEFQVLLFAVAPETRDLGVGKALFGAAERYLADAGAQSAFLFTDTRCTWQFYEHRGMKRAAEVATAPEDRPFLCDEYYVYTTDLSGFGEK